MVLKDEVAIITGASRGIGRAIALAMAKEGARVVINYATHEEAAQDVLKQIAREGGTAMVVQANVSRKSDVDEMMRKTLEQFGQIDILVNNAAIVVGKHMIDTTPEEWDNVFKVNIYGCFYCTQSAAKQMIHQGHGGKIISISSICGFIGLDARAAYSATKGATDAFIRCCALELASHKIRVNGVAPGATDTEINLNLYTPAIRRALAKRIAFGDIAKPEDIAGPVIFLASDASRYITGQTVLVDGGWATCDYTPVEYEEARERRVGG